MIEQEIKYKIAVAIASRQNTKDGINDATEIIYKLFKEQLILSGAVKSSCDNLEIDLGDKNCIHCGIHISEHKKN